MSLPGNGTVQRLTTGSSLRGISATASRHTLRTSVVTYKEKLGIPMSSDEKKRFGNVSGISSTPKAGSLDVDQNEAVEMCKVVQDEIVIHLNNKMLQKEPQNVRNMLRKFNNCQFTRIPFVQLMEKFSNKESKYKEILADDKVMDYIFRKYFSPLGFIYESLSYGAVPAPTNGTIVTTGVTTLGPNILATPCNIGDKLIITNPGRNQYPHTVRVRSLCQDDYAPYYGVPFDEIANKVEKAEKEKAKNAEKDTEPHFWDEYGKMHRTWINIIKAVLIASNLVKDDDDDQKAKEIFARAFTKNSAGSIWETVPYTDVPKPMQDKYREAPWKLSQLYIDCIENVQTCVIGTARSKAGRNQPVDVEFSV